MSNRLTFSGADTYIRAIKIDNNIQYDKSNFESLTCFSNFIFIDIDRDGKPTVLWSGNGVHICHPVEAVLL